jgi:hypothetical protein
MNHKKARSCQLQFNNLQRNGLRGLMLCSYVQHKLCAFEEEIQFVVDFVVKVSLTASNANFEVNPAHPRCPDFHLSAKPRTIS